MGILKDETCTDKLHILPGKVKKKIRKIHISISIEKGNLNILKHLDPNSSPKSVSKVKKEE